MELTSIPILNKLFGIVKKADDAVCRLSGKVESLPKNVPEIIAFAFFTVLFVIISIFHEPWFDEAVAWQIAKTAPYDDMIFLLPHYEGHPPFWQAVLSLFAKNGAPYELSLSLVSFLFSGAAAAMVIFKSPFPRIVRLFMPFTFFLFFQHGIVSRPYCMTYLAFMLAAAAFKEKDEKPWKFILPLMLMCLSTAYGVIMAGGITIAWLIGLLKKDGFRFLLNFKRTALLAALLAVALIIAALVFPTDETYVDDIMQYTTPNNVLLRALYAFIAMPADVCLTEVLSMESTLISESFKLSGMLHGLILGGVIWFFMLRAAKRKGTVLTLVIPYGLVGAFAVFKHMMTHHIGLVLMLLIFWAWVTAEAEDVCEEGRGSEIIHPLMRLLGTAAMCISLFWNISACVNDVRFTYSVGRNEAAYIKEHNLDDYRIMVGYEVYDGNVNGQMQILGYDFNHCRHPDPVLAYFDRNIFFNINGGRDDAAYTFHKPAHLDDMTEQIALWREEGLPEILYNPVDISAVYPEVTDIGSYYIPIYMNDTYMFFKTDSRLNVGTVYMRIDLAEELGYRWKPIEHSN